MRSVEVSGVVKRGDKELRKNVGSLTWFSLGLEAVCCLHEFDRSGKRQIVPALVFDLMKGVANLWRNNENAERMTRGEQIGKDASCEAKRSISSWYFVNFAVRAALTANMKNVAFVE